MHIIIENNDGSALLKGPHLYRNHTNSKSQDRECEQQSSGFTRDELRRIVAEQID
ncbi:hypothetical protein [Phyllobacterium sp. K27]